MFSDSALAVTDKSGGAEPNHLAASSFVMAMSMTSPILSEVNNRLFSICSSVRPMSVSLLYRMEVALWQLKQWFTKSLAPFCRADMSLIRLGALLILAALALTAGSTIVADRAKVASNFLIMIIPYSMPWALRLSGLGPA